ncbi:oxidoreductase [Rhizocola hellebori]|uniref:Oxidoreductase n=1 Tax=Rhizocola hellebori TaxID=1392758 RepID=A0A8J3QE06_9ACTN|nr:CE1759 family FMN reductase [Rhizocola hellebori]GIH07928.1 oxidoreductase [Rhizocola hellebori]
MNLTAEKRTFTLVVVTAGTSEPSSTKLLAQRTAQRVTELAQRRGNEVQTHFIGLRELATEITTALVTSLAGPKLQEAVAALGKADGLVAGTPVYKAGASGLFTSFFQTLEDDLLIAKPVVLAATAGTARHALVVDEQMRSLFGYLRSVVAPTSLFAAPEDWSDPALNKRIDRAALELLLLMESGFAEQIRNESWQSYRHEFASDGETALDVDFGSDLMRLAAGGSAT